jgi:AcrR family transcriptional regulator
MKTRTNSSRTPRAPFQQETQGFRLVEVLAERALHMNHRPRRARTLAAIIAATAQEMERSGIDGLTVANIMSATGLAHGTFYLYFKNRIDAAMAVRRFFDAAMRRFRPRAGSCLPAFEAILRMTRFYVRSYAANSDLLRALLLLLCTQSEYAQRRDSINTTWSSIILRDLTRRSASKGATSPRALQMLLIRSAIAMVDETLREIYVHRSSALRKLFADDDEVAFAISLSWYRIVYGTDPPKAEWPSDAMEAVSQVASPISALDVRRHRP